MILDINGVRNAIQTGASAKGQRPTQADKEKKDRAVAKTILDKLGMESEKYRLGYTKVRVPPWSRCIYLTISNSMVPTLCSWAGEITKLF